MPRKQLAYSKRREHQRTRIKGRKPGLALQREAGKAHVGMQWIRMGFWILAKAAGGGALAEEEERAQGSAVNELRRSQQGEGGADPERVARVNQLVWPAVEACLLAVDEPAQEAGALFLRQARLQLVLQTGWGA